MIPASYAPRAPPPEHTNAVVGAATRRLYVKKTNRSPQKLPPFHRAPHCFRPVTQLPRSETMMTMAEGEVLTTRAHPRVDATLMVKLKLDGRAVSARALNLSM